MQEFTWPGRTAETELALDVEKAALRREFEQRLEECGSLAFRVARGVLRNAADAEDVAQEATTAARAVFGAARLWFQTPNHIPAEEMAARIETMVSPVLFGASQ